MERTETIEVLVKLPGGKDLKHGILTTERAESHHRIPVVVVDGEEHARGPAEVEGIRHWYRGDRSLYGWGDLLQDPAEELFQAALRAGFKSI